MKRMGFKSQFIGIKNSVALSAIVNVDGFLRIQKEIFMSAMGNTPAPEEDLIIIKI